MQTEAHEPCDSPELAGVWAQAPMQPGPGLADGKDEALLTTKNKTAKRSWEALSCWPQARAPGIACSACSATPRPSLPAGKTSGARACLCKRLEDLRAQPAPSACGFQARPPVTASAWDLLPPPVPLGLATLLLWTLRLKAWPAGKR